MKPAPLCLLLMACNQPDDLTPAPEPEPTAYACKLTQTYDGCGWGHAAEFLAVVHLRAFPTTIREEYAQNGCDFWATTAADGWTEGEMVRGTLSTTYRRECSEVPEFCSVAYDFECRREI